MTATLTQRLQASILLGCAEEAIATDLLPPELDRRMRQAIEATREAFGPQRDLPSNVIRIGDHDAEKRFIQALNAVSQEMS